tara:strand:- start:157 stop:258 length:102 start_codon:yes stop_codon:yes gene_type:complete
METKELKQIIEDAVESKIGSLYVNREEHHSDYK